LRDDRHGSDAQYLRQREYDKTCAARGAHARNRRVEFVVMNRGVLQQEIEKRNKPAAAPADTTKTPGGDVKLPPAPADTTKTPGGDVKPPPVPADTTKTPGGGK